MRLINVIFLVAGLLIGWNTHIFNDNHLPKSAVTAAQTSDAIKNRSIQTESHYQGKMDSLEQTNATLCHQVVSTKSQLQQAKNNNKVLQELVDTLIVQSQQATDTASKLADCDSMEQTVQDLIATSNRQDSLYENLAETLQRQVANKDSFISVQQQSYNALKLSFDNSLAQQDDLGTQNRSLQKQLNRHKTENKLLSAGLMIIGGFTAYTFIKH